MNEEPPQFRDAPQPGSSGPDSVQAGIALTVLLHILAYFVFVAVVALLDFNDSLRPILVLLFVGVLQLVYMLPAYLIAISRKRRLTARGLLIGATVTFLLNAACFGVALAGECVGQMRSGMRSDTATDSGSVLLGIAWAVSLHFACAAVCLTFGESLFEGSAGGLRPLIWIGVTQWLYLTPTAVVASCTRRWRSLVGLLCAGGVTIVLNVAGLWLVFRSVG